MTYGGVGMSKEEVRQKCAAALVAVAANEVGVKESGGNNCGPRIREYQAATWLEPNPWPWCAAFVCWTIREWLKLDLVRTVLDLKTAKAVESWRPRGAGAYWFRDVWAKKNGLLVLPEKAPVLAGDIVVFDFSHIGIISDPSKGPSIKTIEGNTNGAGDRDSTSGDGVWRKIRARQLADHYIRILPQ